MKGGATGPSHADNCSLSHAHFYEFWEPFSCCFSDPASCKESKFTNPSLYSEFYGKLSHSGMVVKWRWAQGGRKEHPVRKKTTNSRAKSVRHKNEKTAESGTFWISLAIGWQYGAVLNNRYSSKRAWNGAPSVEDVMSFLYSRCVFMISRLSTKNCTSFFISVVGVTFNSSTEPEWQRQEMTNL